MLNYVVMQISSSLFCFYTCTITDQILQNVYHNVVVIRYLDPNMNKYHTYNMGRQMCENISSHSFYSQSHLPIFAIHNLPHLQIFHTSTHFWIYRLRHILFSQHARPVPLLKQFMGQSDQHSEKLENPAKEAANLRSEYQCFPLPKIKCGNTAQLYYKHISALAGFTLWGII